MTVANTHKLLGELLGKLDGLQREISQLRVDIESDRREDRAEFRDEKEHAHKSRATLYERIDEVGGIAKAAKLAADNATAQITKDVIPTVNVVRRWKVAGVTALAFVGMGSAAVGAFLMWAWDVIVSKWNS